MEQLCVFVFLWGYEVQKRAKKQTAAFKMERTGKQRKKNEGEIQNEIQMDHGEVDTKADQ